MTPQELIAQLKSATDEVKTVALDAQKAAQRGQELSESVRKQVDATLEAQSALRAELTQLAQIVAAGKQQTDTRPRSLGHAVASSAEFADVRAAAARGSQWRGTVAVEVARSDISLAPGSAGPLTTPQEVQGIVMQPMRRRTIRSLINYGTASTDAIRFFSENVVTNNAAGVSELVATPKSDITYTDTTLPIVGIGHHIIVSLDALADVGQLAGQINGRLMYGLEIDEEAQLLNGSGVGNNLVGINTSAAAYSAPAGITVSSPNRMDTLRLAILQIQLQDLYPDGIILSATDWAAIQLLKATDGQYLTGGPFSPMPQVLWGLPVVGTNSQAAGDFTVGAFGQSVQGWDRQTIGITASTEDGDNFRKRAVTVQAFLRSCLATYQSAGLVTGTFA